MPHAECNMAVTHLHQVILLAIIDELLVQHLQESVEHTLPQSVTVAWGTSKVTWQQQQPTGFVLNCAQVCFKAHGGEADAIQQ